MASNEKKSAPCNRSRRGSRTSLKGRDTFLDPKDIEEGIRDITPVAMVPDTPFPSPVNFGIVSPGVFRSGYPVATNFDFIRGLELKTMLYASPCLPPCAKLTAVVPSSRRTSWTTPS